MCPYFPGHDEIGNCSIYRSQIKTPFLSHLADFLGIKFLFLPLSYIFHRPRTELCTSSRIASFYVLSRVATFHGGSPWYSPPSSTSYGLPRPVPAYRSVNSKTRYDSLPHPRPNSHFDHFHSFSNILPIPTSVTSRPAPSPPLACPPVSTYSSQPPSSHFQERPWWPNSPDLTLWT